MSKTKILTNSNTIGKWMGVIMYDLLLLLSSEVHGSICNYLNFSQIPSLIKKEVETLLYPLPFSQTLFPVAFNSFLLQLRAPLISRCEWNITPRKCTRIFFHVRASFSPERVSVVHARFYLWCLIHDVERTRSGSSDWINMVLLWKCEA